MTPQQMVAEFHQKIGGQTILDTPAIRKARLRLDLILEELIELGSATGYALLEDDNVGIRWHDRHEYETLMNERWGEAPNDIGFAPQENLIEAADAIADLLYVVYGTAVDFGINIEPIFTEVHRSNMTKTPGLLRADGKILKGDTFEPPQIERLLNLQAREAWVTPLDGGPPVTLPDTPHFKDRGDGMNTVDLGDKVRVTFEWSKEKGECVDCGLPAAYEMNIYGPGTEPAKLCSVCTAWNAAYNAVVPKPLFPDE